MSANTIPNALGILQDDPDNETAWTELRDSLGFTSDDGVVDPGDLGAEQLAELLEAARRAHEMRREYDAVANLLEIEAALATGEREAELVAELARVRDELLLDDERGVAAYKRLLSLRPDDADATDAIERAEAKRTKWKDLVSRYSDEAKGANDPAFKSSLLVSAAEVAYRYGRLELEAQSSAAAPDDQGPRSGKGKKKQKAAAAPKQAELKKKLVEKIIDKLKQALELDPKNRRAGHLLERVFRDEERWDDLAVALDQFAGDLPAKEDKIAALTRLARLFRRRLEQPEKAIAAYERLLDLAPGHQEATSALVDHFTAREMWEHLVSLYDGQLAGGGVRPGQEPGVILQIAMVQWKMRGRPDAAEPYFERLRKLEPAHPGMLSFFREWCGEKQETSRLAAILHDAQRAMPDGPERAKIAAEIAQHAEEGANAQKAVEQWRSVLRADPSNAEARSALKRLYRQTGAFTHLTDVLRGELERIPAEDAAARLPILREIAELYREHIKSDSALVTVLSQIIALDPTDAAAVGELARVYEALGRWRDLLTTQMRLAELETKTEDRVALYRAVAQRWLDQFSNVQNAMEAYERLRELAPGDAEANEKLKELYGKRRAYRQLFDLYAYEEEHLPDGPERNALRVEMAKLAAERLDRSADAVRLYRLVLEAQPDDASVLDALEKHAERERDWATVAEVLERRVDQSDGAEAKLAALQKLGAVYADRLKDANASLRVWRRVLEASPGHAKATRILRDSYLAIGDYDGLTALYGEAGDWDGLADVLSNQADKVTDPELKVSLSFRCADIYVQQLGSPERAFRSYERVLSVHPTDRRAAEALAPLYEADEKWARVPALYEVLLGHTDDKDEKRALYTKLADVAESKLNDDAVAFGYARKAYELAPDAEGALDALERRAKSTQAWPAFIEAMQTRLATDDVFVTERRALRVKLAEVSATQLGRMDDAIQAYRALLEEDSGDDMALAALDRILRQDPERRDDLRWVFERRIERASGDAKLATMSELALLEEESFGSPGNAAKVHERILEEWPSHGPSLRALSRLLLAAGDAEGASRVLERDRDGREGAERVSREVELARMYLGPLKKPTEALAACRRALELSPNDAVVVSVVEELLPVAETRSQAAVLLDECYAAAGAYAKQSDVLMVLIATAASKADQQRLLLRLADVKDKLGDRAGAFEVLARACAEAPSDLELWDRLAVLANKTHRTQAFVDALVVAVPPTGDTGLPLSVELDLAERAATLYDEGLGDVDKATPYLDRILARDPANERAFARLKQILTTRERWTDLEALYERVVTSTEDPTRRAELLSEVALVAEDITNDEERAIGYYERILAIDPAHEQANASLEKLYAARERWQGLATLLDNRLRGGNAPDPMALHLRLGVLEFERLGNPKSALNHLEEVVVADSSVREARAIIEKCLDVPELRSRAAFVLEGVYAERDEPRELVRALEVRLEFVTDDVERRELLRRIAELRDERLTDDRGAFDAYARFIPLSPGEAEARARFLQIAERLQREADAAEVLLQAAQNADAPQPRADVLSEVARVYEATGQLDAAEGVHKQVLELDPEDPALVVPATRALERLYASAGKTRELAGVLKMQVRLEDDRDARQQLLARLGDLSETVLGDDAGAIEAWKLRLEDDPGDEAALASLDRLYERAGDHRALVEILRARERQANDGATRRELMVRLAQTLADKLGDVPEALLAYRAVLDDFGAEASVLQALSRLYVSAERWPDLAETLEAELAIATEPEHRLGLLARLGDVRRERLDELPSALDAYRQALTLEPGHASTRAALEALLEREDAREEASEILRPLYEADGVFDKLLRVLDIQAELAADPSERLRILAEAVTISEGSLADPGRAFGYASRGLADAAGDPSLRAWLERIERLAAATERWRELADLLTEVAPDILDEDAQIDVIVRVGELAHARLSDNARAKASYRRALEIRPDEGAALRALEELYQADGESTELLEILKRRAELASTDDERMALLFKQARLCDDALGDKEGAIAVYEQILEISLHDDAVAALERLYAAAGRWPDLVALIERELELEVPAARRADLLHKLGRIYDVELLEPERALDQLEEALRVVPMHEATVATLEGLMETSTLAARAAELLEDVYLAKLDWRKVMRTIDARLRHSQDPEERGALLRRLAKLHEEQEENYNEALEVMGKLLAEDITDESTWAELERLARVANAEGRLAEILAAELDKITADEPATARLARRAGELFEAKQDFERALSYYRRSYRFAPEEGRAAFDAIDRILKATGRPAERVTLYRNSLDYRLEPQDRVKTLHTIAAIEETDLGDDDAAILTYRGVLDVDEEEPKAVEALVRLYTRRERWRDVADLHRRRAEMSALPEDEARHRLELGTVLATKVEDLPGAMDEYEAILGIGEPGSEPVRGAITALERLLDNEEHRARAVELLRPVYERLDDWRKLVQANEHRLVLAATDNEKVAILRESATLFEQRGNDPDRAFEALRDAFVLDPDDGDTREELDRVAVVTSRWDDLAAAYEEGIVKTEDIGKRELLEALAMLHDKRRDDPRRALEAYERLFKLDETDVRVLEEMDMLATLLSDWEAVVWVLAKKAELAPSDEERASTWRRIGEARRDMLDDLPGAIDAYERALELEPDSAFTIDNLIDLHESKNDAARLVDLYRRRVELCTEDDDDLKHRLLVDAAKCYELGLSDPREAVALLSEALALKPSDRDVLAKLGSLFEAERMWPDLLDNIGVRLGLEEDAGEQRALKKRMAELLATELDDLPRALDTYREVLQGGYDEQSVAAVRKIGEAREELRKDAADVLEPVLRAAGRGEELVDVLEMRLRALNVAEERAATLRAIAEVCETSLSQTDRAADALLRAFGETPHEPVIHEEIERLAATRGEEAWRRYADAITDKAGAIFDARVTTDLYMRLGRVCERHLGDLRRAAEAYQRAAEQGGDNVEVLSSLEVAYGGLDDTRSLMDVLERRIAITEAADEQAGLFHRLASLQIGPLGDKQQGLMTLRTALEKAPDHAPSLQALEALLSEDDLFDEVFETLEFVYRALGRTQDLGALYSRRVDRVKDPRDRTRARLELVKVLENDVSDLSGALRAAGEALVGDPLDVDALSEVERLAERTGSWSDAASALALAVETGESGRTDVSTTSMVAGRAAALLWARLGRWRRDHLADETGAEEAFVRASERDPENLDVVRAIEALRRGPGRERELVATLRARAKLEVDFGTKGEIYREALGFAEGLLADPALAEATLRDALSEMDTDTWALGELTRVRRAAGDHAEVVTLLLRNAEAEMDGLKALALKHDAAEVLARDVGDKARAAELYKEILEREPADPRAADRLATIYRDLGRHEDLRDLLRDLVDVASSPEERSRLRVEMAKLQLESFDAPDDAVDTLRAVLEEEPDHAGAVVALSEILEKVGRDEELAELLQTQIGRARAAGDAAKELDLMVRLGEILESRVKDVGRALKTFEEVLERDPAHRGALEAVARLCEERGNWEGAAGALAKLLDTTDGDAGVELALRLAAAREKLDDRAGVEQALKRALEIDPRRGEVRDRLISLYEKGESWTELAAVLVDAADIIHADHPELAAQASGGAAAPPGASMAPPPPEPVAEQVALLRRAAEIHIKKRRASGDAVPLLERAAELVPHDRELLLALCDAYTGSGKERSAADVLEKIIASFGGRRSKELSLYHHRLGRALSQLGDKDVALSQFDMAFKIDPGSVEVLKDLGVLALETNDLERAQKTFRALLLQKLDGEAVISKGEVFYYLGEISMKQGDKAKAVQMLERAVENEPSLDRAKTMLEDLKGA